MLGRVDASSWSVPLAALALACSNAAEARSARDPDAGIATACAASVEEANGRACQGDLECGFPIACGAVGQRAECVCRDGRFACVDATGLIEVGGAPRCVDLGQPSGQACAPRIDDEDGVACDMIGRLCFFAGAACAGKQGISNLDYCACQRTPDGTLRFACTVVPCSPSGE